jgi:DNA-binding transcriptional regulator LsrR (DeoR family)
MKSLDTLDVAEQDMHQDRSEYRLMVRAAQLYYGSDQKLEQREIAKKLDVSPSKVSRLLKQAYELGIIKIEVETSRETSLEEEIIKRFGLKDACVVIADDDINLKTEIGRAAALYFERIVTSGMRVGIGGGQTLYHMIEFLPSHKRQIEICPFFVARESALVDFIHPNVLVTLLWQKCENRGFAYTLDIPPLEGSPDDVEREKQEFLRRPRLHQVYQRMQAIDIGFTGIGSFDPDSPFVRFARQVGSSPDELKAKGAVGDISHFVFDREGREVESLVGKATIGLSLERILEIVANPNKKLVAIAGGRRKTRPIYTVLKHGLADTIVTDHNVAEALIELSDDR